MTVHLPRLHIKASAQIMNHQSWLARSGQIMKVFKTNKGTKNVLKDFFLDFPIFTEATSN